MACITDTNSIDLTVSGGTISADLKVDPGAGKPPNPLQINATGVYVQGADGWLPLPATLAFSSASAPTYVATTSVDLTSFISPGMKFKCTQAAVVRYFEVVAITAGNITLYGGDQQVLGAFAITDPYFSTVHEPAAFPALTVATTLPSVAYDGMRIVVVVDAASGYVWNFRYRAASASAYKWEFAGGAEIRTGVATDESVPSSGGWVNLATDGPSFVLPAGIGGDFLCDGRAAAANTSGATQGVSVGVAVGNTTPADPVQHNTFNGGREEATAHPRLTAVAAGSTLKLRYLAAASVAISFGYRSLSVVPLRVG